MNYAQVFFVFFIVFLGGCAAFKKRENAPTILKEVNLKPSFDQALSASDFHEGDWPAYNWWEMFEDEQLGKFIQIAIKGSPDLQAAVSRLRSSLQEARKVRSKLMPDLDVFLQNDYQHLSKNGLFRFPPSTIPAVVNLVDFQLNFNYEIDLFGKNRETYRAAIGEARAMQAEMSEAYLILTVSVTEAYFDYQSYLYRIEAQEGIVEANQMLAELTKQRVLNYLDNEIMLEQIKAQLLQAEEVLTEYRKELALKESQIKILMGLSPDEEMIFERPEAHFDRPFSLPREIPIDLLARRPDLMAQIWKVEAASHLIGASRAAFFPNVSLSAFAGARTLSWSQLFSPSSFAGSLAPAIHLPIFTGFRLTAQLEKSFADFDAEVFNYNTLILRAAKEVSDTLKILQASNHIYRLQKKSVAHLSKVNDLTEARYQNGISDYLSVLQAKRSLLEQVLREVEIQNNRQLAVLHLVRALGGGYDNQEEVNTK